MMQLAFAQLKLSPQEFWAMTPREFEAAIEGLQQFDPSFAPSPEAPTRASLTALMNEHPDS